MPTATICLVKKVYHILLEGKGHAGDDVYISTFLDSCGRYRISDMSDGEHFTIAYKTLPELSDYFRKLADAIDLLAKEVKKL